MTIIMTMLKVNIHEAKANLSKYVAAAGRGETVVICHRNLPVAELRAPPASPQRADGRSACTVGSSRSYAQRFFEPLPAEIEAAFQAANEAAPRQPARSLWIALGDRALIAPSTQERVRRSGQRSSI